MFDYMAQPVGMLIAAPVLIRHLGLAPYGIWLIASAAVSTGSILSSGFGDAVIQRVASLRADHDVDGMSRAIGTMLAINLVLGGVLAGFLWAVIPLASTQITHIDPRLYPSCLWSLRIGSLLIVIKSVESVFISSQRAFERYASAARISIAIRMSAIAISVGFALVGFGVIALMIVTAGLSLVGTAAQYCALQRHLRHGWIKPTMDRSTLSQLASFGGNSWLQAVSGVVFSQADRLIVGATLGASAVAYYGLSIQLAQPIHGLTAAGLNFLFPHLAARLTVEHASGIRRTVLKALAANFLVATFLTVLVVLFGHRVLVQWMGPAIANDSTSLLPLIALAFGMLALNVTGHYAMLALGKVRVVTAVNVAGGIVMLLAMTAFVSEKGVLGAALARLCYGPVTWLLYIPLRHLLREPSQVSTVVAGIEMRQA
jgi:O-antigen/teichoic acid export membrane protein